MESAVTVMTVIVWLSGHNSRDRRGRTLAAAMTVADYNKPDCQILNLRVMGASTPFHKLI